MELWLALACLMFACCFAWGAVCHVNMRLAEAELAALRRRLADLQRGLDAEPAGEAREGVWCP